MKSFQKSPTKLSVTNLRYYKTWDSSFEKLFPSFKNHYIIFCKEEYLSEFLKYFDNYFNDTIYYISDLAPSFHWEHIKKLYIHVTYIQYEDFNDLKKLNISEANHVYILSWEVENSSVSDSGILPILKFLEVNYPETNHTIELCNEMNMRYLQQHSDFSKAESKPAATTTFSASYRKKHCAINNSEYDKVPMKLWPRYAKSDIFLSSTLDSILATMYHEEGLLDVLLKLLDVKYSVLEEKAERKDYNSDVTMYTYFGDSILKYETVMKAFNKLRNPLIPIAIYRQNKDAELKNELPYIITNPKKNLKLNYMDKVICIGKTEIFEKYDLNKEKRRSNTVIEDESNQSINFLLQDNNKSIADNNNNKTITENNNNKTNGGNQNSFSSGRTFDFDSMTNEQLCEKLKLKFTELKDSMGNMNNSNNNKNKKLNLFKNNFGDVDSFKLEENNSDEDENTIKEESYKQDDESDSFGIEAIGSIKVENNKLNLSKSSKGINFANNLLATFKVNETGKFRDSGIYLLF